MDVKTIQQNNNAKIFRLLSQQAKLSHQMKAQKDVDLDEEIDTNICQNGEDRQPVSVVGQGISNLSLYKLAAVLDVMHLHIYEASQEKGTITLKSIQENEYDELASFVLGFWSMWNYQDVHQLNYQLILYVLDLI